MLSVVSLLTRGFCRERKSREIEDLKSKLTTKTDELNKASKRSSEVCILHEMHYVIVYASLMHYF